MVSLLNKGIFVPVPTFFDKNDDLGLNSIFEHVGYLSRTGIFGILVLGSMGEVDSESDIITDLIYSFGEDSGMAGILLADKDVRTMRNVIVMKKDKDIPVFSSRLEATTIAMDIGADGIITEVSNVFSRLCVQLVNNIKENKITEVSGYQRDMCRVYDMFSEYYNISGIKGLINTVWNYGNSIISTPLTTVTFDQIQKMKTLESANV